MSIGTKKKPGKDFSSPYTVMNAIKQGDIFTKLSCVIFGAGNFAR